MKSPCLFLFCQSGSRGSLVKLGSKWFSGSDNVCKWEVVEGMNEGLRVEDRNEGMGDGGMEGWRRGGGWAGEGAPVGCWPVCIFFLHPPLLLMTPFLGFLKRLSIAIHVWAICVRLSYGNSGKLIFDQTINFPWLVFAVSRKRGCLWCSISSDILKWSWVLNSAVHLTL